MFGMRGTDSVLEKNNYSDLRPILFFLDLSSIIYPHGVTIALHGYLTLLLNLQILLGFESGFAKDQTRKPLPRWSFVVSWMRAPSGHNNDREAKGPPGNGSQ